MLTNNNSADGRQQPPMVPQPIPPLLTSFNFLNLGQQRGNMLDSTTIEQH
jgi:hypothetical protein